jgi:two-component system, NtrC family, sensor kinase
MLENEFRLHHLHLEKHLASDIPETFVDVNQMQQVFINLFINAVEATPEQGTIGVYSFLGPDDDTATVEITDTGCGIPREDMDRIFEPFFSTKEKGTGLGLSVSYGIVRNHRGGIDAYSQSGGGSCFSVTFPVPWGSHSKSSKGGRDAAP